MKNNYRTWIEVNRSVFEKNVELLKSKLKPGVKFAGVVKANAYGHGAIQLSKILLEHGATFLSVAYLDEALDLRKNSILAPILMLSQPFTEDIPTIIHYKITPAIYSVDFAKKLSDIAVRKNKVIPVHIKIDTGLNSNPSGVAKGNQESS